MEVYGGVYARVPDEDPARLDAAIARCRRTLTRGPLKTLQYDPAAHDVAIIDRFGKGDDTPSWSGKHDAADDLMALSKEVGDVVAFYVIDPPEFAEFAHWKDGALVRSLQYGDGQWMKAEGAQQAWEETFFQPRPAKALLDVLDDQPEALAEARAVYAARKVEQGARFPWPTGAVFDLLRGPSFGFGPWTKRNDVIKAMKGDAK